MLYTWRKSRWWRLLGFLGAVVAMAIPATAMAASPQTPQCDIEFEWQITNVGSPYTTYGSWNTGDQGSCSSGAQSCTLSFSKTIGWSNSVSGTDEVGTSAISSAVGFTVTYSSSSTAQYSVTYSGGQTATIYWRDVYSTKKVTQEEYYKYICGGSWQPTGTYEYAYAHKWEYFGFKSTVS